MLPIISFQINTFYKKILLSKTLYFIPAIIFTEIIYKDIYNANKYKSNNYITLNNIINDYTDSYIENFTIYQKNQILLHYGIDNAFKKYIDKFNVAVIDKENFTNIIIKNLIIDTFTIININY